METAEPEQKLLKEDEFQLKNNKKGLIIKLCIIFIIILIIGLIIFLIIHFKSDDSSDDSPPFNKIMKEDNYIHLVPKSGKYDYILIFIHGLLGSSEDFVSTFNKKNGPVPDNFKIILPCAPIANVTRLNFSAHSWFDVLGKDGDKIPEEFIVFSDMDENADKIKEIIKEEAKNINNNYKRIFVGGFSQGAIMSFHIGLSFEYTLGGIIPFCGIPHSQTQKNKDNENLNILSFLGGKDIYIDLKYAKSHIEGILANYTNLNIKVYENNLHEVAQDELEEFKKYIKTWL